MLEADGQLAGTPSVLLDAVTLVLTEEAAKKLTKDSAAVDFVCDAWAHLKAIGHDAGAQVLLDHCHVPPDADGVTGTGSAFVDNAAMRFHGREPDVRDLA
jgi:catalase